MNRFAVITASLLAATTSMHSFASSALYTFSAPLYASEVNVDGSSIASGDYLFHTGDSISGTFAYDSSTAATAVDQSPVGLGPTGSYSLYQNSIQNIAASVASHNFSADTGATLVGDGSGSTLDTVFIRAGQFSNGSMGSGFSGFTVGAYKLVSFDLYTFSSPSAFNSQALPATLTNGEMVTAVSLVLEDNNNHQRLVQFAAGNIALAEVPLPASAWLFSSAALILLGRKRNSASA